MEQDLSRLVSMNVLLLKNLLESTSQSLQIDTSIIENEALLAEVEKIRLEVIAEKKNAGPRITKLKSMKDETMELINAKNALSDSNATLQERYAAALREKAELADQLRRARDQLAAAADAGAAQAKSTGAESKEALPEGLTAQVTALERDLAESRTMLRRAQDDLEAKVSNTPQFLQMRKILSDKNSQIADLRKRLAVYEPDIDADDRVRR